MTSFEHYLPKLSKHQWEQLNKLEMLCKSWNEKINLISRKDTDTIFIRHILHSLGIAKIIDFLPNTKIIDVGTGGGFPGIPLAITYPKSKFHLVDSIRKKTDVVKDIVSELGLKNVKVSCARAEDIEEKFDFIVSRAVTAMPKFVPWIKNSIKKKNSHPMKNGILYLKGGDLKEEMSLFKEFKIYALSQYFKEDFFQTKSVVHLPL